MRKTLNIVVALVTLLCVWGVSGVFAQSGTGRPFITKWKGEAGKELRIPIVGTYNMVIKDESGNEKVNETVTVADAGHPYIFTPTENGIYTVEAGSEGVKYMRTQQNDSRFRSLREVVQFGTVKWESMEQMFAECSNMTFAAGIDIPDLSKVTDMSMMFYRCFFFNQPLGNWDVSKVTKMWGMFEHCSSFNQPLNDWKVNKVTDMGGMFNGCSAFNQPLNNWNVSNVTNMGEMFKGCSSFNQPLNNWNVSKVTEIKGMFEGCSSFNQPLDKWDVSNVTNMERMFAGCAIFNQPLNNWNVSNVTNMGAMFYNCSSFNQPLNNWNVSNVTNINSYYGDHHGMFENCSSFNQPLDKWDVSKVTNMEEMFAGCSSFNQPLGSWKIKTAVGRLSETAMSPSNYSQTLIGWAGQKDIAEDLFFVHNDGLVYNDQGKAAHEQLVAKGWRIATDSHQSSGVSITPQFLPLVLNKEFTLPLEKWGVVETTEEVTLSTDTEGIISYGLTADKKGVHIKGLKKGKCQLTATIAAKPGVHDVYTSTCEIEISIEHIPIKHITITPASKTLKVGEEFTLTAHIFPENATERVVEWRTENAKIATVDSNGKVTAKKAGKCWIYAKIYGNGYMVKRRCEVTVVDEIAHVASILLPESRTLQVGTTTELATVVLPDNAEQGLVWKSSDPETAMVSEGVVWGKKKGECTITVKSLDPTCPITKECKITVEGSSNGGNNGGGNNGGGNSGGGNGGNNGGNNGGGNSGGNSGNNGGGNGGNNGGNNGGGDNNGSNPTSFTVTLTRPANGKIEIEGYATKSSITVAKDTELTVKATPDDGYKLKTLKANNKDITTTLKFTVTAATTVTAVFEKETFAVTTSVNDEKWGSIELTGASDLTAVAHGTELTVKVTEKEGYKLKSLTAGDKDITETKKFIVKATTEVKAVFESKQGGAVEDALLAGIVVAPNPFAAQLRILNPEGVVARYEVVNGAGIVVRSGALSEKELVVDTETLSSGIYFVRIEAQNGAKKSIVVSK